jgi:hypothetical protein
MFWAVGGGGGGGGVVVLTISLPSPSPLHRVLVNLRYRKLLSGKKMEYPSPFSIVGVYERGATPFHVLWLWYLVFREVRRLIFEQRIIVFLRICSKLLVVVWLLFRPYPSLLLRLSIMYSSISDTVNCCRARKWSTQVRFLSWAYMKGAQLPFTYCGCNVWCFVRFGGWFSTRRRVVDRG